MNRELYARFATCRVPYSIVVLIEQYGLLPVEDLPVSRSIKNRYQHALQLDQVPTNLLVPGDPYFPMQLLQIPQPVYGLFFRGDPSLLKQPMISIIGSRQPSSSYSKRLSFFTSVFPISVRHCVGRCPWYRFSGTSSFPETSSSDDCRFSERI